MVTDPTAPGLGPATSITSPVVLAFVIAAMLLILVLPRKYALVPILAIALFIPLEQRIVVGGLNFMMIRIVLIAAWIRVILLKSAEGSAAPVFRLNSIDKAVVLWGLSNCIAFIVLWQTSSAVINRMGFLYDTFGFYFLLRFLCRESDDVTLAVKTVAILSMIIAVCMMNEQMTGRNLFAVFGGVPEFAPIREGKLRAQGAFQHSILAGCFGAALLPLCAGLWWYAKKSRITALLGMAAAVIITITSSSSTPLLGLGAAILALCMWPIRGYMRQVRWTLVITLTVLHFSMKAPVWALINKVSVVGGSSSWHRFQLVDQFIRRFNEWWLVGTTSNASWGLDTWDLANHYVAMGTRGGLLTLALFIAIIVCAFKHVGNGRESAKSDFHEERRMWALGATLFCHVVAFYGISYDIQTAIGWYLLLAMIPAAAAFKRAAQPIEETDRLTADVTFQLQWARMHPNPEARA